MRSASTPAAYTDAIALLAARRFPFDELPRRIVGLDAVGALLPVMAGEGEIPPVHAVVVPDQEGVIDVAT